MSLFAALLILGFLIFIHELGHFTVAKLCGVGVDVFSIGFGRRIWGKKFGETEYQISLIPLGGYVKMQGESLDGDDPNAPVAREKSFAHKTVWQRIAIVIAGPIANIALPIILLAAVHMNGVNHLKSVVGNVMENSAAAEAGMIAGDRIVEIEGKSVTWWDDLVNTVRERPEQQTRITVERNGTLHDLIVTPRLSQSKNIFGEETPVGLIGIASGKDVVKVHYGPLDALWLGSVKTWELVVLTVTGIVKMIQQVIPADNIGGPIMIVQVAADQVQHGMNSILFFMALISVNLGILNLLPIPILDGGHLMFYLIEALTGKRPTIRVREIATRIGMALLATLMIFAFYNDIRRLIFGTVLPGSE
ncbi:RIP metalloprotease RseP [Chrysiogenes arsenatis]|uniref:RIP metalloprotease RseP n=1 Tax=Chrysiogenes arsenatis TaxID=309797 RepID=UPI00040D309C|nr:RIP metalloprotease RseP [Chrysiogenes arsenatis]